MPNVTATKDEAMKPLCWPPEWSAPSPMQKFLIGVPFIGLDKRLFSQFRRQLSHRDKSVLSQWESDQQIISVRDSVSQIIAKILHWPNSYFIPDDLCSILFFDPTPNLDSARAIMDIENKYGKSDAFGLIPSIKYGDFINRLRESKPN
jgi:hypothetical protein